MVNPRSEEESRRKDYSVLLQQECVWSLEEDINAGALLGVWLSMFRAVGLAGGGQTRVVSQALLLPPVMLRNTALLHTLPPQKGSGASC